MRQFDEADLKEDDEVVEHIHEECQDRRKREMKMVKRSCRSITGKR